MQRMILCLCFVTICTISLYTKANEVVYSFADLKILAANAAHDEFFKHALDIRPSLRDKSWQELVSDMGVNYLSGLISKSHLGQKEFTQVTSLSKWPSFAKDEFFIDKRDQIFLRQISQCYKKQNSNCQALTKFINHDFQHNHSFAFELITTLANHGVGQKKLWYYSRELVANKFSEFYCNRVPLKEIVINQIYHRYGTDKQQEMNIHTDCYKVLAKTLKTYLKSSKIHQREAAYQNLKNQNLLTSKDEAIYQTMTLLADKNFLDHELDLAIISMKSLGSKPKLRLEILNQLKKIDPLPGKLFIKKSSIINQAKTRVFSRYFPEYIDFYAHTCIDYLSENKIFPLGNPTPYCHDLFSMNKKINILPATLTKQYSKATFFINSNSRK